MASNTIGRNTKVEFGTTSITRDVKSTNRERKEVSETNQVSKTKEVSKTNNVPDYEVSITDSSGIDAFDKLWGIEFEDRVNNQYSRNRQSSVSSETSVSSQSPDPEDVTRDIAPMQGRKVKTPSAFERLCSSIANGIKSWLGILRVDQQRIDQLELKLSDPIVRMFFKGNLHNDCAAAVLDRIRDYAVNGSQAERSAALRLLLHAANQVDQDNRLSFYEEYYDRLMLNQNTNGLRELTRPDQWMILSRHGTGAKILQELTGGKLDPKKCGTFGQLQSDCTDSNLQKSEAKQLADARKLLDAKLFKQMISTPMPQVKMSDQDIKAYLNKLTLPGDHWEMRHLLNRLNEAMCSEDEKLAAFGEKWYTWLEGKKEFSNEARVYATLRWDAYCDYIRTAPDKPVGLSKLVGKAVLARQLRDTIRREEYDKYNNVNPFTRMSDEKSAINRMLEEVDTHGSRSDYSFMSKVLEEARLEVAKQPVRPGLRKFS